MPTRFCKKCDSFMDPEEIDGALVMKCTVCDNVDTDTKGITKVFSRTYASSDKKFDRLSYHFALDPALKRTSVKCPSDRCPTNDAKNELFGDYEAAAYTKNNNAVMGLICTRCRANW